MQRVDRVITQTRGVTIPSPEMMEATGVTIEQVQAAPDRSDPQIAEGIFGNRTGVTVGEPRRILAAIGIAHEATACRIVATQAAAERADPQSAAAIFV